jgi:hypothetical protein
MATSIESALVPEISPTTIRASLLVKLPSCMPIEPIVATSPMNLAR